MIDKYNAFISYRHSLQDNKIAKEVQTQLEHFRIPHKIRKSTGKKRIDRIFRDKEELPITSDLNEDIDFALAHSDYLIVLCSTHTCESIWVQKEIETFLKNHTKKEILTVLVDGEPEEVIPDILMHDTVTRTLNDGSQVTYEEVIEPLSCDYRLPIKTARKEELPRIAASIIGCSYDELMRRRRQYRIRRAVIASLIAAVTAIGVMGYLTWSLTQIRQNYNKALVTQAQNLSLQSESALDDGDKVKAIDLALQALPSEENPNMPVTDEAWAALSDALGSYIAPGQFDCEAVWKYEMESTINDFTTNEDGTLVAACDSANNVRIWDSITHEVVADITYPGEEVAGFGFSGKDTFIVMTSKTLAGYDISDWEEKWSMDVECYYSIIIDNGISSFSESSQFVATTDEGVIIADSKDGEVIKCFKAEDIGFSSITNAKIARDGKHVAIECPSDQVLGLGTEFVIYNLENDAFVTLDSIIYLPLASRFTEDGNFVCLSLDEQESYASSFGNITVMAESTIYIEKYDTTTGELMWSSKASYMSPSESTKLYLSKYIESDGTQTDVIVALYSDRCTLINDQTGEIVKNIELPAQFVSAYSGGDSVLLLILYNGQYVKIKLEEGNSTIPASKYFDEKICQTDLIATDNDSTGFVTRRNGDNYLIEYNTYPYDESFEVYEQIEELYLVCDYCVAGDYFIIYDDMGKLYAYDIESGDVEWTTDLGPTQTWSVDIIGPSPDGEKLYVLDDSKEYTEADKGAKLIEVDLDSGDFDVIETLKGSYGFVNSINGNFICMAAVSSYSGECTVFRYEIEEEDLTRYEMDGLDSDVLFGIESLDISPDGNYLIIRFNTNTYSSAVLLDMDEDEFDYIDEEISGNLRYAWNEDSSAYACGKVGSITVFDLDGDEILSIDTEGRTPMGLQYYGEDLIAVYSIGVLARYDKDGNLLSEEDFFLGYNNDYKEVEFTFLDDELLVNIYPYATIFSLETFKVRGVLYYLDGYYPEQDLFICHGYLNSNYAYGYFANKDISELIEEGYEYISIAEQADDDY